MSLQANVQGLNWETNYKIQYMDCFVTPWPPRKSSGLMEMVQQIMTGSDAIY